MTPPLTLREAGRLLQKYDVKGRRASSAEVQELVTMLARLAKVTRQLLEKPE